MANEVTIQTVPATVTLIKAGVGDRAVLACSAKRGHRQRVELIVKARGVDEGTFAMPAFALIGDAEVVSDDGDFVLTIDATDCNGYNPGYPLSLTVEASEVALASLIGMTFSGRIASNGAMSEVTMRGEHALQSALELLQDLWPPWPIFPSEPIGVGAHWRALGVKYKLVARDGDTWIIKSLTRNRELWAAVTEGAIFPFLKTHFTQEQVLSISTVVPQAPTQAALGTGLRFDGKQEALWLEAGGVFAYVCHWDVVYGGQYDTGTVRELRRGVWRIDEDNCELTLVTRLYERESTVASRTFVYLLEPDAPIVFRFGAPMLELTHAGRCPNDELRGTAHELTLTINDDGAPII